MREQRSRHLDARQPFRVGRIEGIELRGERYRAPDQRSVAEIFWDGRAFVSEVAERVRIRFALRVARWIAEREGQEFAQDGTFVLELPLADPDWVVRYVLQYGPEAEVLEPVEVRAAVRARLQAMCAGGSRG